MNRNGRDNLRTVNRGWAFGAPEALLFGRPIAARKRRRPSESEKAFENEAGPVSRERRGSTVEKSLESFKVRC